MNNISIIDLRQDFIDFFRENGHKYMSPSKVFNNDPSLMFVNAGMNQLKDVFLGEREPNAKFTQLTNSQICIRAGGKHNDLDDVGFDSYHLTSFEMLGNWSLDRYRKEKTIELAFHYLIKRCGLDMKRIYVTYFGGYPQHNLAADEETHELWKKWLPDSHIIPGSFKDNFWMMSETGPCGACTEIHYDLVENREKDVPELVNADSPELIEIWNLVFTELNRVIVSGENDEEIKYEYRPLEKFYVDTGMGLERLATVLHGQSTVYQTDAFRFLIGYAQALSNGPYFTDTYDKSSDKYLGDVAYRIFGDHIRTTVVALFDGVEFGCNKREFVLRKIFRRLLIYFYLYLNRYTIEMCFGHPLVKALIKSILDYHLKRRHDVDKIHQKLIEEERLFVGMLTNLKLIYHNQLEKSKIDGRSRDEIIVSLKESRGVPSEIIENLDKLTISNK